jgi:hypothetical protein
MIAFLVYVALAAVLGVLCLIAGVVVADQLGAAFWRPAGAHASVPAREVVGTARSEPDSLEEDAQFAANLAARQREHVEAMFERSKSAPVQRRPPTEPISLPVPPLTAGERQRAHADAMHALSARYLPPPPPPRPVNGRPLGTQPHYAPAAVKRHVPVPMDVLRRVRTGLIAERVTS